jgi:hypothetical protein
LGRQALETDKRLRKGELGVRFWGGIRAAKATGGGVSGVDGFFSAAEANSVAAINFGARTTDALLSFLGACPLMKTGGRGPKTLLGWRFCVAVKGVRQREFWDQA